MARRHTPPADPPLTEEQFLNWLWNIYAILLDSRVAVQKKFRMSDERRDTRVFFRADGEGYAAGGFAATFWEQQQFIMFTQLDMLFNWGASGQVLSFNKLFAALPRSENEPWLLSKLQINFEHAQRGERKGLREGRFTGAWDHWYEVEDFMRDAPADIKPNQPFINTIEHHRNTGTAHSALMHDTLARSRKKKRPMV